LINYSTTLTTTLMELSHFLDQADTLKNLFELFILFYRVGKCHGVIRGARYFLFIYYYYYLFCTQKCNKQVIINNWQCKLMK